MQKFIVTYATGSYDTHYVHQYGMEAEDKIDIQLWFLSAVELWKMNHEKWIEIQDCRPKMSGDEFAEWMKEVSAFIENHNPFKFTVNGMEIHPLDDMHKENFDPLHVIEIYTFDEWFEDIRPKME